MRVEFIAFRFIMSFSPEKSDFKMYLARNVLFWQGVVTDNPPRNTCATSRFLKRTEIFTKVRPGTDDPSGTVQWGQLSILTPLGPIRRQQQMTPPLITSLLPFKTSSVLEREWKLPTNSKMWPWSTKWTAPGDQSGAVCHAPLTASSARKKMNLRVTSYKK